MSRRAEPRRTANRLPRLRRWDETPEEQYTEREKRQVPEPQIAAGYEPGSPIVYSFNVHGLGPAELRALLKEEPSPAVDPQTVQPASSTQSTSEPTAAEQAVLETVPEDQPQTVTPAVGETPRAETADEQLSIDEVERLAARLRDKGATEGVTVTRSKSRPVAKGGSSPWRSKK